MANNQTNKPQQEQQNKKKKGGFALWWHNLGKGGRIAISCLAGAAVVAAVAVPVAITMMNKQSEPSITVTGATIDREKSSIVLNKDSTVAFTYGDDKEFVKINFVKVGDKEISSDLYTLVDGNTQSKKVVIKAQAMTSIKVEISVELKDKGSEVIKVNSVSISNTKFEVESDEEIELTATVLPEEATNKELAWTITAGSDKAEIREDKTKNKFYLKGKSEGDVTVKAAAKDGSEKSDSKNFKVTKSTYLEYTQVGQTDTCLVKAKSGKTLPENVVIPEKDPITSRTVVGIAPNGFSGPGLNVKTITFEKSDNITTISYNAFLNNNSLVSFTVPKNVEVIGGGAFQFDPSQAGQTRSLTTITIETGSKLKKIGGYAFTGQTSLNSITIPSTVEYIGSSAFCSTGLTSATFGDTATNWLIEGGDGNNEVWTPTSDASANAAKLKSDPAIGYWGIVKNTITISGDSSVEPTKTIALTVPTGTAVYEWYSSDTSKATVNSSGVVTGVAEGDCYIYVVADEGASVGIKKITVAESIKSFNVAWTKSVEFSGTVGTTSPYELAKQSTELIIGTNKEYESKVSALSSAFVGETTEDKITAYYDNTSEAEKLYILSDKKISFADNDRPNYVSKDNPGSGYFASLSNLKSIILTNIDTSKTTNMHGLFYNNTKLESLDLKSFDTSNVENMAFMFTSCTKLSSVDLTSFNTKKVKTMEAMFLYDNQLTILDISTFSSDVLENTESMFSMQKTVISSKLKTIYANDEFDISKTKGDYTFDNCDNLKGGSKFFPTAYSGERISSKYGVVDLGDFSNEAGYFTDKRYSVETDLSLFDFELKTDAGTYYSVKAKEGVTLPEIVVLPDEYNGISIKKVEDNGFLNRTELKGIVLPYYISGYGDYAFKGCTNLKRINSKSYAYRIGKESFKGTKISYFTFLTTQYWSDDAFDDCDYLNYFIIESQSIANIGADNPTLDINNTIYKNVQEIRILQKLDVEDESIISRYFNYKSSKNNYDYYVRKK